jgi:serine/threonine-protein kinase
MSDPSLVGGRALPTELGRRVEEACNRFEAAWRAGTPPRVEDHAGGWEGADRAALLCELVPLDADYRRATGAAVRPEDYLARFPELGPAWLADTSTTSGEPLDADLAVAPGPDSGLPLLAEGSVARALGTASRVHLREPDGEAWTPVVRPNSANMPAGPDPAGRLQLHGEIARGGMGAILKGRDTDLGRDIAVKVLLETHRGKTELVQRFVEEAQIAGQLQHPGVAPVYELGVFADRRPYFTMKLVKGKTLAALLAARPSPVEDRAKFVGVFAQVCQTLAYAHARGVIHRDLKPANVMVGAFGEVQVMDWGLSKVLQEGGVVDERKAQQRQEVSVIRTRRSEGSGTREVGSDTQAGSVLGTPAYMPPEQARGEVDLVDERSDVFGLGAILCEILTGQPPFSGKNAEAMRKARTGAVAEACARLDGCGADAELIGLAKRCLAAEPWNRPRDAGQAADAVTTYLNSVAERLRQAELAQVAAAARAEEEAKRRVLADQLAATAQSRAQVEAQRRRLTLGLAAAVLALIVVGGAGTAWWWQQRMAVAHDVEVELAEVAGHLAHSRWSEARAALERSEGRLGDAGPAGLRERVRQARSDLDMVTELDEIRIRQTQNYTGEGKFDLTGADRHYAEAFRKYGIDVERLGLAEAAAQVRASAIRETLLAGLDNWMRVKPEAQRTALRAVADGADDNPWRLELRAALLARDLKQVQALAWQPEALEQPPGIHVWLGDVLSDAGLKEEAVAYLGRALARNGGDFWINFNLGRLLKYEVRPSRPAEANVYFRIALAIRPINVLGGHCVGGAFIGGAFIDLTDPASAVASIPTLREAIKRDPKHSGAHCLLGYCLWIQGKFDEGFVETHLAVDCDPKNAMALNNLADYFICCVDPKRRDPRQAVELAKKAVYFEPYTANYWDTLGEAHFCDGDWTAAINAIQKSMKLSEGGENSGCFILAMAHWRLGHKEEARSWYARAVAWMKAHNLSPTDPRWAAAAKLLGVANGDAPPKKEGK